MSRGQLQLFVAGFLVAVLLGATGFMIRAQTTGVIYACVSKTGAVRIVSGAQCAKGESLLSWNQEGPQGPPGAGGLKVVDNDGRFVGYPFGPTAPPSASDYDVLVPINDRWYKFTAAGGGLSFVPASTTLLYYEAPDCAGIPYVLPDTDETALYHHPLKVEGQTVYLPARTTPTTRMIWSDGPVIGPCPTGGIKTPYPKDVVDIVTIQVPAAPPLRFSH